MRGRPVREKPTWHYCARGGGDRAGTGPGLIRCLFDVNYMHVSLGRLEDAGKTFTQLKKKKGGKKKKENQRVTLKELESELYFQKVQLSSFRCQNFH